MSGTEITPGTFMELETRHRTVDGTDDVRRGPVFIRWTEPREGFLYVGWENRGPRGEWSRDLGAWGNARVYPDQRPYGSTFRALPADQS